MNATQMIGTIMFQDTALEDAGFAEFLLHIRSKSEVFEDNMMVHTGFYGDPQKEKLEYEKLIWTKLENRKPPSKGETVKGSLPQELMNGTHYRKLILILHFADERASKQLKLLRDLLGRDRNRYHEYAMANQRLYGIWSKDPHSKLMNLKYVDRTRVDSYISLLSDELRLGVEIFILSENTNLVNSTTTSTV